MGETTHISWADSTFNPWIGCTEVSVGAKGACVGCYAREQAKRWNMAEWGNHPRHRTSEAYWNKPFTWDRKAAKTGQPHFVFCASLADVFDNQVSPMWRMELFDLIHATPHLTWLLLTKRPQNILKLFLEAAEMTMSGATLETIGDYWPANAAIGCTVVTQAEADRDIPWLLAAKAALKPAFAFLSMEPLMEAVNIMPWLMPNEHGDRVGWVIAGGETDQGRFKAREPQPDWFRLLRDQCGAAGVAFHFKQWGDWYGGVKVGHKVAGALLDGVLHRARPAVA